MGSIQASREAFAWKFNLEQAYLWAYRGDREHPYEVFDFTMSHSRAGPMKFLGHAEERDDGKGFRGYLQADAHAVYDALFRRKGVVEFGCWAYARRKFFEAKETVSVPRNT
jgi:transposase